MKRMAEGAGGAPHPIESAQVAHGSDVDTGSPISRRKASELSTLLNVW